MPHSDASTRDEFGNRVCPYCGTMLYRTAGHRWPQACAAHSDLVIHEPFDDRYLLREDQES